MKIFNSKTLIALGLFALVTIDSIKTSFLKNNKTVPTCPNPNGKINGEICSHSNKCMSGFCHITFGQLGLCDNECLMPNGNSNKGIKKDEIAKTTNSNTDAASSNYEFIPSTKKPKKPKKTNPKKAESKNSEAEPKNLEAESKNLEDKSKKPEAK